MSTLGNKFLEIVFVGAISLSGGCSGGPFSTSHGVGEVENAPRPTIINDRLILFLETESYPWTVPDSPAQVSNVRWYWVSIGYGTNGLTADSTIAGPLYVATDNVSVAATSTNSAFTEKDKADLNRMPRLFITSSGDVGQIVPTDKDDVFKEWHLKTDNQKAEWKFAKERLGDRSQFGGGVIKSDSRRFFVKKTSQTTYVFDQQERVDIDDKWLEQTAAKAFSRGSPLWHTSVQLTEDLKYVTVKLQSLQGNPTVDFTENGKTYSSKSNFLVYTRPENTARVVAASDDESDGTHYYSVNGPVRNLVSASGAG